MAKKTIQQIVQEQRPGFHVASNDPAAQGAEEMPDAVSDSLNELKRKYLGQNLGLDSAVSSAAQGARGANGGDDVEIVPVEPNAPRADSDPPHRAKAAVISRRQGRIIGEQG